MKKILSVVLIITVLSVLCSCSKVAEISPDLEVYFFAAGEADAILVTTDGSTVLIDTGESETGGDICDHLSDKGIDVIDYMIITHFDGDHVSGAAKVLKKISVRKVLTSNYTDGSSKYDGFASALSYARTEAETVREVLEFELDGAHYTVYPPQQEEYVKDPSNNSSLIVSVEYGEKKFLFCGDAEKERLTEFSEINEKVYDFVKIPHHGRWNSALPDFIGSVSPEYAVITSPVSAADRKTADLLKRNGVSTYFSGDTPVTVICDGKEVVIY